MQAPRVVAVLEKTEQRLREKYRDRQGAIMEKFTYLRRLVQDKRQWWQSAAELDEARARMQQFLDNIEFNYADGSQAWHLIDSASHRRQRLRQLADAVLAYEDDRHFWQSLMDQGKNRT
jgi:hypothetical protein